ncbi:MAG: nucleotidyltransferase family protein [Candidatus Hodarchaeales archaeon]
MKSLTIAEIKWDSETKNSFDRLVQDLESKFDLYSVILFGSRVTSMDLPSSDWDILLVIEGLDGNWLDMKYSISIMTNIHIDPHLFTRNELANEIKKPNFTVLDAVTKGKVLYDDGTWQKVCLNALEIMKKYEITRHEDHWKFNPEKIPY